MQDQIIFGFCWLGVITVAGIVSAVRQESKIGRLDEEASIIQAKLHQTTSTDLSGRLYRTVQIQEALLKELGYAWQPPVTTSWSTAERRLVKTPDQNINHTTTYLYSTPHLVAGQSRAPANPPRKAPSLPVRGKTGRRTTRRSRGAKKGR